ncbi:uncharacterized protein LOC123695660 [Colias croceus]|uniref:uncharacterized protein LOC123695660 n=1 Tax=Colias crocea TaxID=72248 RepID=UPI001E27A80F|nr:uncharacterized protein LOC123695660 [Colias croceus]
MSHADSNSVCASEYEETVSRKDFIDGNDSDILRDEIMETAIELCKKSDDIEDDGIMGVRRERKREREKDENEWQVVKGKEKKQRNTNNEKIEVYVSHPDKMPKQFELAKLFKELNISNVIRIKYLNPYRIRIEFTENSHADKILSSTYLQEKGFKVQQAMEVSYTYGVIRNVELKLNDEEIKSRVQCDYPAQLVSVQRCRRREGDNWEPCETIRLCFKGSYRPPCVYVDGLRVDVEKYVHSVSQCRKCWRLGHTIKRCPSSKVVCPKCGGYHANCDTMEFKCINCGGKHMALSKTCPMYIKEHKIRDIMADFSCTYRKALTLYVAPETAIEPEKESEDPPPDLNSNIFPTPIKVSDNTPSYADIVKTKVEIHEQKQEKAVPKKRRIKTRNNFQKNSVLDWDFSSSASEQEIKDEKPKDQPAASSDRINFSELLLKLKDIVFLNKLSWQAKISKLIQTCIEWIILLMVENISDWPLVKNIVDSVFKFSNG